MITKLKQRARGQTTLLVALVMGFGVLMGFVALAVDGGSALLQRRNMQNGADGAALAIAQTLAGSVVYSGTTYLYTATNSDVTSHADQLLAGNRGGTTGTPNYNATIEYGTFTGSGYTYRLAATYSGGSWQYENAYPAGSLVPSSGSTSVDAVRVNAGIDNPTMFARLVGISTIAVSAKAASALNSVTNFDVTNGPSWPMTRCWFPDGVPDSAAGVCNPYLFWASNLNDPGCPTNANFKNLLQLGKRQGHTYEDAHDQLITQWDTSTMLINYGGNNPCGGGDQWWSAAGNCSAPGGPPYGDRCCGSGSGGGGTAQMKYDVVNWIRHNFTGRISLDSAWPSYTPPGTPPGDWIEVYNAGNAGNNIASAIQAVIDEQGQSDHFSTNFGNYVDRTVFLYDVKQQWSGTWLDTNANSTPDRIHMKQAWRFRFYRKLAGSGGNPTQPSICAASPPNVGNSEVYGVFVGEQAPNPPCDNPPCQVGHGLYNYVGYIDP